MQQYSDTIQDRQGNVIGAATVTVTNYPSGTTATTYATNAIGSNTNPITADNNGQYSFYATDGSYTVTTSKSGITTSSKVITLLDNSSPLCSTGFASLAAAITAAGSGAVIEPTTGQLWLLGGVTPTFDENGNVVARCLGFDTGATLTIPAAKQFDAVSWGDNGTNQVFSIGAGGEGAGYRFNLESAATSSASSNLYGVIGQITNKGPGTAKALYGRAIASAGCTGNVIGATIGANSLSGATAYGIQLTFDTDTSGVVEAGIWQTSNTGTTAKVNYGLLMQNVAVQSGGAGFQMQAKGTGNFLLLKNAAASADLWFVDSTGMQTVGSSTNGLEFTASSIHRNVAGGNLTIDAGSGATLYCGINGSYPVAITVGALTMTAASVVEAIGTVTYSASMTPNAALGNVFTITATNNTAFTINAPTNPGNGQRAVFTIRNTSGGALGVATWNAVFKMVAWTQPANGFSRSIQFHYDGTNWVEEFRSAADVPN